MDPKDNPNSHKRPRSPSSSGGSPKKQKALPSVVAAHYDKVAGETPDMRAKSKILHMRDFNNWIKFALLKMFVSKPGYHVLDIAAGRGGDIHKFRQLSVASWTAVDISPAAVEEAANRYSKLSPRPGFGARFVVADCTGVALWTKQAMNAMFAVANAGRPSAPSFPNARYPPDKASWHFDAVSCQFAIHYAFRSEPAAKMFLANVASRLKPGGYFVGTTVDSRIVRKRLVAARASNPDAVSFGDDVCSLSFKPEVADSLAAGVVPPFGGEYFFHLADVVNVDEYLVDLDTIVAIAESVGLRFVYNQPFMEFFDTHKNDPDLAGTLRKKRLVDRRTGALTLSPPELAAASLYMVFAFQKPGSLTLEPAKPRVFDAFPPAAIARLPEHLPSAPAPASSSSSSSSSAPAPASSSSAPAPASSSSTNPAS